MFCTALSFFNSTFFFPLLLCFVVFISVFLQIINKKILWAKEKKYLAKTIDLQESNPNGEKAVWLGGDESGFF